MVSLGELREDGASETSIRRLLSADAGFSATTICAGHRRLIAYNPRHAEGRRANSIAHEVSHMILEHVPTPAIGVGGCRHWNPQEEAEADWLAAVLLVPRESALAWMLRSGDMEEGAAHFGVSYDLFRWRVNHTGVMRQVEARRRYTRSRR